MADLKTQIVISLVNKITEPLKRVEAGLLGLKKVEARLKPMSDALGNVGTRAGAVGTELAKLGAIFGGVGGGALWLFKTQFLDVAAKFEQYTIILKTLEGSSAKAQKSMDWVSDFAAKTPYELDQVMEAFIRLRAYGMDPTNGMLKTLGDTASSMGKPLIMAVEAIADAVTGENERLKEFGIKAQTKGNLTRYEYSDREGNTRFKTVNNKNRPAIQDALLWIMSGRYGGGMEEQSKGFKGMFSNLKDQWTRLVNLIMANGAFDFIKGKLEKLLATVDRMAASGELKKLSEMFGTKLADGVRIACSVIEMLAQKFYKLLLFVDKVATALGGYDNLLLAITAVSTVRAIASIASLITSLASLKTAFIGVNAVSGWLGLLLLGAGGALYVANQAKENGWSAPTIDRGSKEYNVMGIGSSRPAGWDNSQNTKQMGGFFNPQNNIHVTLNVDKDGRLQAESKDPNTRVDARGDFSQAVLGLGY